VRVDRACRRASCGRACLSSSRGPSAAATEIPGASPVAEKKFRNMKGVQFREYITFPGNFRTDDAT
jgi:hypothetical protein